MLVGDSVADLDEGSGPDGRKDAMTTKEMKHTPGPWHYDSDNFNSSNHEDKYCGIVGGSAEWIVAEVCGDVPDPKANARLIAAAPELLEALKEMQQAFGQLMPGLAHIAVQDYANINEAPIKAAKAIAKAEGR